MREETKVKLKRITHKSMMDRCYLESNSGYYNYGGKGITVEERWHTFDNFILDVPKITGWDEDGYMAGELTLDKDKKDWENTVYCLEKCSFISPEENNQYKPNQQYRMVGMSPKGEVVYFHNASEMARDNGLHYFSILEVAKGNMEHHKGWQFCMRDDYHEGIFNNPDELYRWLVGMDSKGNKHKFHNASEFARENGLIEATTIYACANLKNTNTRGWQFRYEDELGEHPFKNPEDLTTQQKGRWVVGVSPDGEEYVFNNRTKFAKEHGLHQSNITQAIKNNREYRGWKFKWKHEEFSYVN